MDTRTLAHLANERGAALPMAMFTLVILMAMTLAFTSLATTEPVAGRNHILTAQARVLAESGIERAVFALVNAAAPGGVDHPATPATAYNGTDFHPFGSGGFTLSITNVGAIERNVVAIGWTPTNDLSDPRPKGVKRVQATLKQVRAPDVPCALCVMGTLEVAGNASIDARSGTCPGVTTLGGTMSSGGTTTSGAAKVWGPGNNDYNEPQPEGALSPDTPYGSGTASSFGFKFTTEEWSFLRSLARSSGTYLTGSQSFGAGRALPNGLVFVDTTTGADLTTTPVPTPSSQHGNVSISGGQTWSGWLIVAGSVSVSGSVALNGLLYAQNDVSFTGNGTVSGGIVTENRIDAISTVVLAGDPESGVSGTVSIQLDCTKVRTGGSTLPQGWYFVPGSFRETTGRS